MRYFFNVILKGETIQDLEGTELASEAVAQQEALTIATELEREFHECAGEGAVVEVFEGAKRVFATPIFRALSEEYGREKVASGY